MPLELHVAHTPRCQPPRRILVSYLSVCVCVCAERLLRIHSTQLPSQLPFGFAGPHQSPSSAKNAIQAIFNLRCTHVAPLAQDARNYPGRTVFTVTVKTPTFSSSLSLCFSLSCPVNILPLAVSSKPALHQIEKANLSR